MKKIYLIIIAIFFACCNYSFSQTLDLERIVTTNFPTLRAEFRIIDSNGDEVRNINMNDLKLKDLGIETPITAPICPPDQARFSLILIFDASNSMDKNISDQSNTAPSRINVVKQVASRFIDQLPEGQFEAAMGFFHRDYYQYDLKDFTSDKELLKQDLNKYTAIGATNYNAAFLGAKPAYTGGAFELVKKAQYKPVIVFMTDGYHQENSLHLEIQQALISSKAAETNTTIFSIFIGPTEPDPDDSSLDPASRSKLETISKSTGGDFYDGLLNEDDIQNIYTEILDNAKGFGTPAPCYVEFEADCDDGEVELTYTGFQPPVSDIEPYEIPDNIKPRLEITNRTFIEVNQPINTPKDIPVKITAENNDVRIDGYNSNFTSVFYVSDWGGSSPPFTLKKGESRDITVTVKPEQRQFYKGEINFEGFACSGLTMVPRAGFIYAEDIVFASVNQGDQETKTFTQRFCNLTDEPVTISNLLISGGANPNDFGITSNPQTVAAGDCIDIEATFRPTDQGDRSAQYIVKTNRGDFVATIKGGGAGKPEIAASATKFGDVNCTNPKSTIVVEVTNNGPVELNITNIALADGTNFTYTGPTTLTIPPNTTNNSDVTVDFTPQANGVQTTDLIFTNNSDNSPYSVKLEGEMLAVNYSTTSTDEDFGTICANVGNPVSRTIDLTNISSFDYSVSASSDLPEFTTDSPSYNLSSGNTTVTINFEASANQQYNGKITFTSECGNVVRVVNVTGRVNSPEVNDNTTTIAAVIGTNQTETVSVTNPNSDSFDVVDAYVGDNAGNPLLEFSLSATSFTVPGNGNYDLQVTYTPDASDPKDVDGLLYLIVENPCDVTLNNILLEGRPDLSVAKLTITDDNSDYIGRVTTIPVTLTGDAGFMSSGTSKIVFRVQYNDAVLMPTNGTIINSNEVEHSFNINTPFTGTQVYNMQFEVLNSLPTIDTDINFSKLEALNSSNQKSAGLNSADGKFKIILADGEATTDELSAAPGEQFTLPIYILDEDDNLDEQLHKDLKITVQYNFTVMQPIDADFTILNDELAEMDITGELKFTTSKKGNKVQEQFAFANIPMLAKLGNKEVSEIIIKSVDVLSGGVADFVLDTANFTLNGVCREGGELRLFTLSELEPSIRILESPISSNTEINLTTIETGLHSISIYDVVGNKVTIDNRNITNAGSYKVNLDINSLHSGNYIIHFDTPTQKFSKNIIIVK